MVVLVKIGGNKKFAEKQKQSPEMHTQKSTIIQQHPRKKNMQDQIE